MVKQSKHFLSLYIARLRSYKGRQWYVHEHNQRCFLPCICANCRTINQPEQKIFFPHAQNIARLLWRLRASTDWWLPVLTHPGPLLPWRHRKSTDIKLAVRYHKPGWAFRWNWQCEIVTNADKANKKSAYQAPASLLWRRPENKHSFWQRKAVLNLSIIWKES